MTRCDHRQTEQLRLEVDNPKPFAIEFCFRRRHHKHIRSLICLDELLVIESPEKLDAVLKPVCLDRLLDLDAGGVDEDVEPVVLGEALFNQKGHLRVWVTDDEVKMPVLMKSKVLVGAIAAVLTEYRLSGG
mgnify:CR=1 FL=1